MYIGHFGLALAAKRAAPEVSLGTLFTATQLVDFIWPVFLIAGIEQVSVEPGITAVTPFNFTYYPFSHSLLAFVFWATLFVGAFMLIRRDKRGALIIWLLAMSHWALDFITHIPDLPLYPGSDTHLGLGLWNSLAGTLVLEGLIFISGVVIYLKATRAKDRIGSIGLWALVLFLAVTYIMNIFGTPPPDDPVIIGAVTLSMLLLLAWGWWVDRHRTAGLVW